MKNRILFSVAVVISFIFLFPTTVYANSSWHWVSSTRPLDLLPIVIIITLVTEILSVNYIAKVKDLKRVIKVVSLANLASFLLPYIWLAIDPHNVYSFYNDTNGILYTIKYTAGSGPIYTVSLAFLVITLLTETPIVYLFFRKRVPNKRTLLWIIIAANLLTTAITFAVERIFCYGEW